VTLGVAWEIFESMVKVVVTSMDSLDRWEVSPGAAPESTA
jgi:hypothetical protein